jgi:hypothetical protein
MSYKRRTFTVVAALVAVSLRWSGTALTLIAQADSGDWQVLALMQQMN